MQSIINISDEPYEFTFDGGNYGPFQPGQIVDLPDEIARHAIKRSVIMDDEGLGEIVGRRCALVSDVPASQIRQMAKLRCPFVQLGQCSSGLIDGEAALRAHMEIEHFFNMPQKAPSTAPKRSAAPPDL